MGKDLVAPIPALVFGILYILAGLFLSEVLQVASYVTIFLVLVLLAESIVIYKKKLLPSLGELFSKNFMAWATALIFIGSPLLIILAIIGNISIGQFMIDKNIVIVIGISIILFTVLEKGVD